MKTLGMEKNGLNTKFGNATVGQLACPFSGTKATCRVVLVEQNDGKDTSTSMSVEIASLVHLRLAAGPIQSPDGRTWRLA